MLKKKEPQQLTRKELNLLVFMYATERPYKSPAALCKRMVDKGLLAIENKAYVLTDLGKTIAKRVIK